ncbi:MAG: inositol monophosphatase [Chloroflexi bacterium]|nr:inositol monophosphatase [Chloroflexota bacterium]
MDPRPLTPGDAERALSVAVSAARIAGREELARLGRVERVRRKSARDVVTDVDHLAERLILDEIRSAFPGDAMLAEESGEHAAAAGAAPTAGTGRAWIVDPLDGTVNYANGIPVFTVSIALAVDGRPCVGVVLDPVRDELFTAVAGEGTRLNGRRVVNPDKPDMGDYVIGLGYAPRDWRSDLGELRRSVRAARHLGSAALELSYVAAGRLDACIHPTGISNWDVAAAGLIAEEGGAVVTTADGQPWFELSRPSGSIGILAAPARHHRDLLGLFLASGRD